MILLGFYVDMKTNARGERSSGGPGVSAQVRGARLAGHVAKPRSTGKEAEFAGVKP